MTSFAPPRRLKMNARRRSPFMLLLGLLTAGAPVSAAARGGSPRRERAVPVGAAPERRLGEVGLDPTLAEVNEILEPWYEIEPEPRVRMLWQVGVHLTWVSGHLPWQRPWHEYDHRQLTHDLGVLVRDRDGRHHWGGATTFIWQDYDRNLYGLKAIRRWSLDGNSDAYLQLAPGVIVGGEQGGVEITPGGLLELEVGNTWVALTTGVHTIGWRTVDRVDQERGLNTTTYAGIRTHGLIGLGVYLGLFAILVISLENGGWS